MVSDDEEDHRVADVHEAEKIDYYVADRHQTDKVDNVDVGQEQDVTVWGK
jgi:hypothetical protein